MPTRKEITENNRLSRRRQQLKREVSYLSENILSPDQQQYLEQRRQSVATGGITSTKERKKIKKEIDQFEQAIEERQAQIDQTTQAIIQEEGLELPSDVGKTSETGRNRRDVSQESVDARRDQDMDRREREAGLFLAGNDPLSGRRRLDNLPSTIEERERAAGLFDTTSGRETTQQNLDNVFPEAETEESFGSFPATICINGLPFQANIVGQIGGQLS